MAQSNDNNEESKAAAQMASFDVFSGIDGLAATDTGRRRGGNQRGGAHNRRLNSEDDITLGAAGGGMQNESDISSEDFDNQDDFNDLDNQLEGLNDRLQDPADVQDDQLSEISSSLASTD